MKIMSKSSSSNSTPPPSPYHESHVLWDEFLKLYPRDNNSPVFKPIIYDPELHSNLRFRNMCVRNYENDLYDNLTETRPNLSSVQRRKFAQFMSYYPATAHQKIIQSVFKYSHAPVKTSPTTKEVIRQETEYNFDDGNYTEKKKSQSETSIKLPTITSSSNFTLSWSPRSSELPVGSSTVVHKTPERRKVIPSISIDEQLSPAMDRLSLVKNHQSSSSSLFKDLKIDSNVYRTSIYSDKPLLKIDPPDDSHVNMTRGQFVTSFIDEDRPVASSTMTQKMKISTPPPSVDDQPNSNINEFETSSVESSPWHDQRIIRNPRKAAIKIYSKTLSSSSTASEYLSLNQKYQNSRSEFSVKVTNIASSTSSVTLSSSPRPTGLPIFSSTVVHKTPERKKVSSISKVELPDDSHVTMTRGQSVTSSLEEERSIASSTMAQKINQRKISTPTSSVNDESESDRDKLQTSLVDDQELLLSVEEESLQSSKENRESVESESDESSTNSQESNGSTMKVSSVSTTDNISNIAKAGSEESSFKLDTQTSGSQDFSFVSLRKRRAKDFGKRKSIRFIKLGRVDKESKLKQTFVYIGSVRIRTVTMDSLKTSSKISEVIRSNQSDYEEITTPVINSPLLINSSSTNTHSIRLLIQKKIYTLHADSITDFELKFNTKTVHHMNHEVTHVISEFKHVMNELHFHHIEAVAFKKFLISIDWIIDSLRDDEILDERNYEVYLGDFIPVPAARIARHWPNDLFFGYAFLLRQEFYRWKSTLKRFQAMLENNGAVVTGDRESFDKLSHLSKICIVESKNYKDEVENFDEYLKDCVCAKVYDTWIARCFMSYDLVPITKYLCETSREEALEADLPPNLL